MNGDIGILAAGPGPSGGSAKIDRIPGHEGPVAGQNERLQLPVAGAATAKPCDVGGAGMAHRHRALRQLRPQAFATAGRTCNLRRAPP